MRLVACKYHIGKVAWPTRREADIARRSMRKGGKALASDLKIFQCEQCGGWLLGSKQAAKRKRRWLATRAKS